MADPSGADADATAESDAPSTADDPATDTQPARAVGSEPPTEAFSGSGEVDTAEPTEVISAPGRTPPPEPARRPERRFTAPSGFDAGSTEKIDVGPEPATEVMSVPTEPVERPAVGQPPLLPPRSAAPRSIPPRGGSGPGRRRSWGWVLALILVIAALAAVAILGTVWLTHKGSPRASRQDQVRSTIQDFDIAVQKGDLATLRGITCGTTRDAYVSYDDRAWADTHARVAAAKQYPVVASIDQVVVNGDHAEANVTSFMAFDPATRSTRSFDLQFRDNQWKICQAPNG